MPRCLSSATLAEERYEPWLLCYGEVDSLAIFSAPMELIAQCFQRRHRIVNDVLVRLQSPKYDGLGLDSDDNLRLR